MTPSEPCPRHAAVTARGATGDTPITIIQSARQVGKSTLATMVAAGAPEVVSVTLDDPAVRAVAESDPVFFVE